MMKPATLSAILLAPFLILASGTPVSGAANEGARWFQVEISVFTNEFPEYRNAEFWTPDRLRLAYPERVRSFARFSDFLLVPNLAERLFGEPEVPVVPGLPPVPAGAGSGTGLTPVSGPFPFREPASLRLPDLDRDPFLLLPARFSNFETTNSRLDRSPNNRLLFTGVWRQPVVQAARSPALLVQGGRQYGRHHELEGTVTIRFNDNEDRVVIDTSLWLTDFTRNAVDAGSWALPEPPLFTSGGGMDSAAAAVAGSEEFWIRRIVHMEQSRPMRSNEFHYLDHPAMGVVISVFPYELPPAGFSGVTQPVEPF